MGKENSSVKNMKKKAPKKTSLVQFHKNVIKSSSSRKLSTNNKTEDKEFDEAVPLIFLNNPKEKEKLNAIDERIKLLKTELKSLLVDLKIDKIPDQATEKSKLVNKTSQCLNVKDLKDIKPLESWECLEKPQSNKNEFKPNFNSTPFKFSDSLDDTVKKLDNNTEIGKPETNELLLNSVLQMKSTSATPEATLTGSFDIGTKNFSGISLLSQQKVEQLLYKSFCLQNSAGWLSSAEAVALELNKCIKTPKQMYKRSRSGKKFKRGPIQRTSSRFLQCGIKQRISNPSNSHSEVEIITLDSSSVNNEIPNSNVECVDLDVSSFDWSEPFDVNESTDHSDIQVIEDTEKKSEDTNYKQVTSNNSDLMESELSACYDKNGKLQQKKIWECPVCFEGSKGQEIIATQCGHVFCRKCIEKHISKLHKNCPTCRCDLKDKTFITLFNF